ncbi:MAG: glutamate racemase, partial [Chloroflexi bacterium]
MSDPRPIGVFDSGVGGLTVLRELQRQLPHESTVYFGDLGHFPYGPRYQAQVRHFALNIIRFLEKLDVKLVVIACNTATAAALNTAREVFDIPIIGVITPGAEAAVAATRNKKVAVISTEGTLQSQEYLHAIREANPTISVLPRAAPELVDLVEAGKAEAPETEAILRDAL